MDVTNQQIYEELQEIKKILKQSIDLQKQLYDMEEEIKFFEGRQLKEEEKIASAVKKKRFASVFEWKSAIWDHCPYKKEHVTQSTVSFHCNILNGPCMFESCPRNLVEEQDYMTSNVP
jgi:hypothetical protein